MPVNRLVSDVQTAPVGKPVQGRASLGPLELPPRPMVVGQIGRDGRVAQRLGDDRPPVGETGGR